MNRRSSKPTRTFTDHLVSMVCPVLIMAMTGSLVFFMIEVGYQEANERFRWVMFWFVVAAVLIPRISILQGSGFAGMYALALGTVTLLWLHRFVGLVPLVVILIVLIWLCAHRLTWDCTFLDDDQNAEGSMLGEETEVDDEGLKDRGIEEDPAKKRRRNRRPGLWIIWFSLGALPTFGIGQAVAGADDPAMNTFGFQMLCIYLAAGLGLLVATSFLNVRQYLRQHYLRMPARVTRSWLFAGATLSGLLLSCVLLLPRPHVEYSVASLIDGISTKAQEASEWAMLEWDATEDDDVSNKVPEDESEKGSEGEEKEGESGDPSGENGTSESGGQTGEGASGEGTEGQGSQGKGEAGNADGQGEGQGESQEGQEQSSGQAGGAPPQEQGESMDWVGSTVKWVLWLVIGGVILFLAIRNRKKLIKALREFIADLLALFGKRKKKASAVLRRAPLPKSLYADFRNPFLTGMADRWSPEELIGYTFQALRAWAHDRHVISGEGKTPLEFAEEVAEKAPELREEASAAAELYSKLAFTQYGLSKGYLLSLKKLWAKIS